MSETIGPLDRPDFLLSSRGASRELDAFVVAVVFDRAGGTAAFGCGDGTVRLVGVADTGEWRSVIAHDGGLLALSADAAQTGFVSGGDDGKLCRVGTQAVPLASFGSRWVERVATWSAGRSGVLACAVGRTVHVIDDAGAVLKRLEHPSTVTGIAFDAKGKRIATSHYGGASLWYVASKTDNARPLEWKGSHTGIVLDPAGDSVVTSMQENALHGWRLSDGQHMRMSGYPSKTQAMSFTRNGRWLATSGAESVVLWPFFGGGPMGKAPTELAGGDSAICSFVACHPLHEAVAAGFSDGLVVLADIATGRIVAVRARSRARLSWTSAWRRAAVDRRRTAVRSALTGAAPRRAPDQRCSRSASASAPGGASVRRRGLGERRRAADESS